MKRRLFVFSLGWLFLTVLRGYSASNPQWIPLFPPLPRPIDQVYFVSRSTVYATVRFSERAYVARPVELVKSDDGGSTWLSIPFPKPSVLSSFHQHLTLSPKSPNTIYCVASDLFDLFVTDDDGQTWTSRRLPDNVFHINNVDDRRYAQPRFVLVSPDDSQRIACVYEGRGSVGLRHANIIFSDDGGALWTPSPVGFGQTEPLYVMIHPVTGQSYVSFKMKLGSSVAGLDFQRHSADQKISGADWTQSFVGFSSAPDNAGVFIVQPAGSEVRYATDAQPTPVRDLYKPYAMDAPSPKRQVTSVAYQASEHAFYLSLIDEDSNVATRIADVIVSTDEGKTWFKHSELPAVPGDTIHPAFFFFPDDERLYATAGGSVYVLYDAAALRLQDLLATTWAAMKRRP